MTLRHMKLYNRSVKMKIPNNIKQLMQKLINNEYDAYVVGGAVRDYLMGVEPHDYDIFTNATGEQILKIFPQGKVIGGEERQAKILTVVVDGVEISQYRSSGDRTEVGNTLSEHQATCDFTINSIACDINGEIIDEQNGISDFGEEGNYGWKPILRFVGNPEDRIREDPLRILRGIRFLLKYNLTMEKYTEKAIRETNINHLPKERIREELIKILSLNAIPKGSLYYLIKFLPKELQHENMFKEGGEHHNEIPYEHCEHSLLEACKITDDWRIRLAALLHDVAKGVCRTEEIVKREEIIAPVGSYGLIETERKEIHFYEHEKKGKEIVEDWMREMKFSNDEIAFVSTLVKWHMYSYMVNPGKKSYIRFFKTLEDNGVAIEDYVMLLYADHQGNQAKKRIKFGDFVKGSWIYHKYFEIKHSAEPMKVGDLVISGKDLIERYGMKPGPEIGKMLKIIFDKIMDGDLRNERAEIFHWLEKSMLDFYENRFKKK